MVIWRYMNIEKLEELLESNTLIFTALNQFPDQYEGHNTLIGEILSQIQSDAAKLAVSFEHLVAATIRESSFVNCWTRGRAENAAFWEIYGKRGTTVAIRSTYNQLRSLLPREYVIGQVKYVDYNSSPGFSVADSDSEFPFFEYVYHKRLEYSYENEIRAARIPRAGEAQVPSSADVVIPNPAELIDMACIRRSDCDTEKERVKRLCSRHELQFRESRMNEHPLQIRLTKQQADTLRNKIAAARLPRDLPEKVFAVAITRLLVETLEGE